MKKVMLGVLCLLGITASVWAQEDQTDTEEFYWPPGDSVAGRAAFVQVGCVHCHQVARDPSLPAPIVSEPGPALNFSREVPVLRIAQAIISPSHTIAEGYGRGTPEEIQKSPMLDLTDRMTVRQLVDILAYLRQMDEPTPNASNS